MLVLRPYGTPVSYAKLLLHADEQPWFVPGDRQIVLEMHGRSIAPAICFESLQDSHARDAADLGADLYMVSVAKSANGVVRAFGHYPFIARRHAMIVAMANAVGPCDNFVAAGRSAVWSARGELLVSLDGDREGVAVLDTSTGKTDAHYL